MSFDYSTVSPEKAEVLRGLADRIRNLHAGVPVENDSEAIDKRQAAKDRAIRERLATKVVIYFAEAVGSGRVKIGQTRDVYARLGELQAGCPFPLSLLGTVSVTQFSEIQIHGMFAEHRVLGEWFTASDSIHAFIAKNGCKA